MTRLAYISSDAGAGDARFYKILRDRKNGRTLNATTNTWKLHASVAQSDRRLFVAQQASPRLGEYALERTLGPVGELWEYTCDLQSNDGRPFYGERRYVSDGSYPNTPDTADTSTAGLAHFEFIHGETGLGPNRLFKRAYDWSTGEIWNQADDVWDLIANVSDSDSRIFLIPETNEFANVYGTDLEGMGSRDEIWLYDYDAQLYPNQPSGGERFRLTNGAITSGGSLPPFKVEATSAHGVLTFADRLDPDNEPDSTLIVNALAVPTLLARIADSGGTPVLGAAISSISYSIYELARFDPAFLKPVAGHYKRALAPAAAIYDVLQIDYLWRTRPDSTGYNFRTQLTNSDANGTSKPAFPDRGKTYGLIYTLTPQSGEAFDFRYLVKTKP